MTALPPVLVEACPVCERKAVAIINDVDGENATHYWWLRCGCSISKDTYGLRIGRTSYFFVREIEPLWTKEDVTTVLDVVQTFIRWAGVCFLIYILVRFGER